MSIDWMDIILKGLILLLILLLIGGAVFVVLSAIGFANCVENCYSGSLDRYEMIRDECLQREEISIEECHHIAALQVFGR